MSRRLLIYNITFLLFHISQNLSAGTYSKTHTLLSDQAKVSVITCAPGDEIYSVFGHTALRVADPVNQLDQVYNYGTFDFNTSNFYLKFAKGNLAYFLSSTSFANFVYSYQLEGRALSEQVLRMNQNEVQTLYNRIEENLQPGKKYYRYQFFADNCTTRIYRLLTQSLVGNMTTDTSYIQQPTSYRQLFTPYLQNFPWVRVGMNIGLGIETDRKVSFEERLFLPKTLETALNHSYTHSEPLVAQVNLLLTPVTGVQKDSATRASPLLLVSVMAAAAVVLSLLQVRSSFSLPLFDGLVFGITGMVGVVLLSLWLFSLHTPTHQNVNLLWLTPLHLLFIASGQRWKSIGACYAKINIGMLCLLIVINSILQLFIVEFYPVAITLIARFVAIVQTGQRGTYVPEKIGRTKVLREATKSAR